MRIGLPCAGRELERFRDTGLHKTLMPAAYGGYEMGFSAMLETSVAIGKSARRSLGVRSLRRAQLGRCIVSEGGAGRDVGPESGAFISDSYAPIGKAAVADGGYGLFGPISFLQRVAGGEWNLCGAMLPIGPEGKPVPAFTLVPKADYRSTGRAGVRSAWPEPEAST